MGRKLYVGNLPFTATDQVLMDTFSEVGQVESAKVIFDRETGRSKGFGFVEMVSDAAATAAIDRFNGQELAGRPLTVNEAKPMAPRDNAGGGGGGGGGYGNRSRGGRY